MNRSRNTDTQVALPPEGGKNEQPKAKKMAENGPAKFQDGCNPGGGGSKFLSVSYSGGGSGHAQFLG